MITRVCCFSFILLVCSLHIVLVPAAGEVIRIMPLGDSITRGFSGSTDETGYRRSLYFLLTGAGYAVDFVGSLDGGIPVDFDRNHEGHSGFTTDEVAANVYAWLETNPADIVLLHIGTNDIGAKGLTESLSDIELILDEIDRFESENEVSIWVILALIINRNCTTWDPPCPESITTTNFNNNVAAMAQDRIDFSGDKILIVDMENGAGFDYHLSTDIPPGDMWDYLHPFDTGYQKMANVWYFGLMEILNFAGSEIIGSWSDGIWYWDMAKLKWTIMWSGVPSGDIAAGDFSGDGTADVASIWSSGLWYQDGDTLSWTQVYHTAPDRIAAADITGDGVDEIIGCGGAWSKGVWYRDVATGTWYHPWSTTPNGAIAAGDVTGDGKADMVSCWKSGLWYQDGATLSWTEVWKTAPDKVTCGDVSGDGQAEIIGTWSSGIWYWDVAASKWTKMWSNAPSGDIAAGDFTGDGKADVASCWNSGLWYQNGDTLGWTKVWNTAPYNVTAGNVTGE